ncbi:MAG: DNA polymerase IV, partial [Thermoleophilia bacterium]
SSVRRRPANGRPRFAVPWIVLHYERMFVREPVILHVDMDAFFASVEQARDPALRGRPVIVGGRADRRSVVTTASYEARAFGVRTAMPVARALRLCPEAVLVPGDMRAYAAVHRRLIELFGGFTDRVEVVSIDEAFLDVTGSRRLFGPPQAIARRIQQRVVDDHGITCSIGIGPNKLLAKLASDLGKPAGLTALTEADVHGRLRELPVRALHGIGPVAEERLLGLGLTSVGLLQDVPDALLAAAFGPGAAGLKHLAFGRSLSPVSSRPAAPRSMGRETTFPEDVADPELLRAALLSLSHDLMTRLRGKGYAARTVSVKVRDSAFHTVGRSRTLPRPTTATRCVYDTAACLLGEVELGPRRVRLVGVTVGDLQSGDVQLTLDDGWRHVALDEAVDRVRSRYGRRSVRPAAACAADAVC